MGHVTPYSGMLVSEGGGECGHHQLGIGPELAEGFRGLPADPFVAVLEEWQHRAVGGLRVSAEDAEGCRGV